MYHSVVKYTVTLFLLVILIFTQVFAMSTDKNESSSVAIAWGEVKSGIQAGILVKTGNPSRIENTLKHSDPLPVKIFIKNSGKKERIISSAMLAYWHWKILLKDSINNAKYQAVLFPPAKPISPFISVTLAPNDIKELEITCHQWRNMNNVKTDHSTNIIVGEYEVVGSYKQEKTLDSFAWSGELVTGGAKINIVEN